MIVLVRSSRHFAALLRRQHTLQLECLFFRTYEYPQKSFKKLLLPFKPLQKEIQTLFGPENHTVAFTTTLFVRYPWASIDPSQTDNIFDCLGLEMQLEIIIMCRDRAIWPRAPRPGKYHQKFLSWLQYRHETLLATEAICFRD
jgi:hypothetical protein